MKTENHKSSTGMDANVFAMLVYIISIILGWIPYVYYAAWVFPMPPIPTTATFKAISILLCSLFVGYSLKGRRRDAGHLLKKP